jgi:hypothetical protein
MGRKQERTRLGHRNHKRLFLGGRGAAPPPGGTLPCPGGLFFGSTLTASEMQPKTVSARRPAAVSVAEIGDFCFADDGKGGR